MWWFSRRDLPRKLLTLTGLSLCPEVLSQVLPHHRLPAHRPVPDQTRTWSACTCTHVGTGTSMSKNLTGRPVSIPSHCYGLVELLYLWYTNEADFTFPLQVNPALVNNHDETGLPTHSLCPSSPTINPVFTALPQSPVIPQGLPLSSLLLPPLTIPVCFIDPDYMQCCSTYFQIYRDGSASDSLGLQDWHSKLCPSTHIGTSSSDCPLPNILNPFTTSMPPSPHPSSSILHIPLAHHWYTCLPLLSSCISWLYNWHLLLPSLQS